MKDNRWTHHEMVVSHNVSRDDAYMLHHVLGMVMCNIV